MAVKGEKNPAILLVGESSILLETRSLILAEWASVHSNSAGAIECLETDRFDIVVIGHTVPTHFKREIIAHVKAMKSAPTALAVVQPEETDDFGVETHVSDLYGSPGWIRERVAALLADRNNTLNVLVSHSN